MPRASQSGELDFGHPGHRHRDPRTAGDPHRNRSLGQRLRRPGSARAARLLPPDGEALPPGARPSVQACSNKCQRTTSVCSDAVPATRHINSKDVTRACWQWTDSFDCVDLDPRSDCSQPRSGRCASLGPRTASPQDTFFSPPVYTAWRTNFQCQTRGPVYDTVADCGPQQFCTEGTCWDTGHPPDTDFARAVTLLEAQREAGKYLDVNALRVFKGFDNRCDRSSLVSSTAATAAASVIGLSAICR